MRQAKQQKASSVAERAQQMATERNNKIANDLNNQTNNGTFRAMEANRVMLKESALEASTLSRQGRTTIFDKANESAPKYEVAKPIRDEKIETKVRSIQDQRVNRHRRVQHIVAEQDSLPPGYRKALEREIVKTPSTNERPSLNRVQTGRDDRPVSHKTRYLAKAPAASSEVHGIYKNPIVEARNRRELEKRLDALGNN